MPALLLFLGSIGSTVFAFLAARIGAKLAMMVVLVGAYVAAASAFAVTINGLIGGVLLASPSIIVTMFSFLPTNTDECLGACIAAEAAAFLYRQIVIVAGIKSRI